MNLLTFFIVGSLVGVCFGKLEMKILEVQKMNETDEMFKYTVNIEKVDEMKIKVNSESDLFVTLDDEWHMWIQLYHNSEGKRDFDKPMINLPKKSFCEYMKTFYKDNIYPRIKDVSNFPAPEECPVKPNHFSIKDLMFDMEKYSSMAMPGMFKVAMFISQDHEESHITKLGINTYILVEDKE